MAYTVVSVDPQTRPWDSSYGPMVAYTMTLRNDAGSEAIVEWSRKPDSRPPTVGQSLNGTVEQTPRGLKFKTAPNTGGNRGGGGGGGGPRETHPRDAARMGMHGAIGHALTYLDIKVRAGRVQDDFKPTDVIAVAELFAQAIDDAGARSA